MKYKGLFFGLLVLLVPLAAHSTIIVNNSGTSGEDSLNVPVLCLDSLGKRATADSFFVVVIRSGTNAAIFSDSGTIAITGMDSVRYGNQFTAYYYHRAVADIDGAGAPGSYTLEITAKMNAQSTWATPNRYTFQVVDRELSDVLYAATDSILRPTVAGRTADVTTTGGVGIDWANVESPTTTVALSGTTVGLLANQSTTALRLRHISLDSGFTITGANNNAALYVYNPLGPATYFLADTNTGFKASGKTGTSFLGNAGVGFAVTAQTGNWDGMTITGSGTEQDLDAQHTNMAIDTARSVGSVAGSVGSVTGAVGSVTGNVGGNVVGSVASVTGAVGSVTGNVGGSVASVVGAVGSVTGSVGSVASGGITAASVATDAFDADALAADAGTEIGHAVAETDTTGHGNDWTSAAKVLYYQSQTAASSFDPATDSVMVDMSSFNTALDNDTTLVTFLRAILAAGGSSNWTNAQRDSVLNFMLDNNALVKDRLIKIKDSVYAILDSIQNSATLTQMADTIATRNVGVNLSNVTGTLDAGEIGTDAIGAAELAADAGTEIGHAVAETDTTGHGNDWTSAAKVLYYQSQTAASSFDPATDSVIVDMSSFNLSLDNDTTLVAFLRAIQAAGGSSNWTNAQRDSVLAVITDGNPLLKAKLSAILDTLQNHDNWVAKEASLATAGVFNSTQRDSLLNALADANTLLKNRLLRIRDSVDAALDSLQNQDNWIAQQAEVTNLNGWAPTTDAVGSVTGAVGSVTADVTVTNLDSLDVTAAFKRMIAIHADSGNAVGTATVDSAQLSRLVKRTVWGIPVGVGSDSTTKAQRVVSTSPNTAGYTVYITVIDTVADTIIQGCNVYVNNAAQTSIQRPEITNVNGIATFNLDTGTYVRYTTRAGYAFDLDTFTVAGSRHDSLKLYRSATTGTMIIGRLIKPNGDPYSLAKVSVELVSVNDSLLILGDSVVVSNNLKQVDITATTDGYFTVDLIANRSFTNDSTYYRLTAKDWRKNVLVADIGFRVDTSSAVVQWADLPKWRIR